jgi:NAD(P)-dependent dehydrogenase (short-subunit alcohol dehydrogenase family)
MTFQPHHAIVTASDSGIGRATAVALAEAGMNVGITWTPPTWTAAAT